MAIIGCIVLVDPLLDEDEYEWILLTNSALGLPTFKINKYSDLLISKYRIPQGQYLFFDNPRMRFNIEYIVNYLKPLDLNLVKQKTTNKIIAFNPRKIKVAEGFIHAEFPFILDFEYWEVPPKIEMPDLFLLTHSRHDYLKLTLNALLYSLGKDQTKWPNIKIFMNAPTSEVFELVCNYQQNYPTKIEWYRSEVNIKFKAIKALMDYFDPKIFLYCEEDFILPEMVKNNYPYWPQQFAQIASKGGFVGWRANNIPKEYFDPVWVSGLYMKPPKNQTFDYRWEINYGPERIITGHIMAIKSSLYRSIDKAWNFLPAVDHHLSASAKFEASPTILGYHIGYNTTIDYKNYNTWADKNNPDYRGEIIVLDNVGKMHIMQIK